MNTVTAFPSPSLRVVALAGSPTPGSRSTALLHAALELLRPVTDSAHLIELRALPPAALLAADTAQPELLLALERLQQADVVLVATPIYQAAYSGLLKVFLDLLPQRALRGKQVLPLATGGSPAHLLALDYALKPVLGALGTPQLLEAVFATDEQFQTLPSGFRVPGAEAQGRLRRALEPLLPLPRPRSSVPDGAWARQRSAIAA
mgnify:FL=1